MVKALVVDTPGLSSLEDEPQSAEHGAGRRDADQTAHRAGDFVFRVEEVLDVDERLEVRCEHTRQVRVEHEGVVDLAHVEVALVSAAEIPPGECQVDDGGVVEREPRRQLVLGRLRELVPDDLQNAIARLQNRRVLLHADER